LAPRVCLQGSLKLLLVSLMFGSGPVCAQQPPSHLSVPPQSSEARPGKFQERIDAAVRALRESNPRFVAAIVIPVSVLFQLLARRPLMDLRLLMKPTFGWAIALATFYRFGLVMTAFVVPQALMNLQGFRMPEIAGATIWMFWAECVAFPLAWYWATRGDARLPLSLGLMLFAVGAFLCTFLTPSWQAGDFRLTMIAIGFGQGLFLVPTVLYAARDVAPQQGTTAASLFNLSRVVGQTFGIAAIATLITEREKFHSNLLVDSFNSANPALIERFNGLVATFLGANGDRARAQLQAWQSLSGSASTQAYVLAFADAFVIVGLVMAVSAVLVLMLPPLRESAARSGLLSTEGRPKMDPVHASTEHP
jgi:MFS transporter, DHA2 family, multidrug resistance protein